MGRDLTVEMLSEAERAVLEELVEFGNRREEFAAGTLDHEARAGGASVEQILSDRLTPAEVHELCAFVRAASTRAIRAEQTGEHIPDVYDAEDFFAWCFEPEPENRRPGPRVSVTARDADHARQLLRSIKKHDRLRELFFMWDRWRRSTGRG